MAPELLDGGTGDEDLSTACHDAPMPPESDPALSHVPSHAEPNLRGSNSPTPRLRLLLMAALLMAVGGCSTADLSLPPEQSSTSPTKAAGGRPGPTIDRARTLAQLEALPVKGRAPKTGYSREEFGPAWTDVDHNGCDTRNDVLRRDLTKVVAKPGTHECIVVRGVLNDPYTGRSIPFTRGQGTSTAVQIDHVVALSDAWQKGAQQLPPDRRRQLANDPLNLLAVDGPANGSKSDGDAATWLPPNKGYRCAYVARQVAVKTTYKLWMTSGEKAAIRSVLALCPAGTPSR